MWESINPPYLHLMRESSNPKTPYCKNGNVGNQPHLKHLKDNMDKVTNFLDASGKWIVGLSLAFGIAVGGAGLMRFSDAYRANGKERTIQAALLSSTCKDHKHQKDSLLARYVRGE